MEIPAFYTTIIWDPDAPYPNDNYKSPMLHYLRVSNHIVLVPLMEPNPPKDSPSHRYYIQNYLQPESELDFIPVIEERSNFPLKEFVSANGLTLVSQNIKYYPPIKNETVKKEVVPTLADPYFIPEAPLNEVQRKYCRCLMHVGSRNKKSARNPYAICTSTVGMQSECSPYYYFEGIPDDELLGFADRKKIDIPSSYSRQELVNALNNWRTNYEKK